jgi:hypothetical protein
VSWDTRAVDCIADLDNLHMENLNKTTVYAVFELKHLLIEGTR